MTKKKPAPKPPRPTRVRTRPTPEPEPVAAPKPGGRFSLEIAAEKYATRETPSGFEYDIVQDGRPAVRVTVESLIPVFGHDGDESCDCPTHFFERARRAIDAGESLPWPKNAPPAEDLERLTFLQLYRLVETFREFPGSPYDRAVYQGYIEEALAVHSLRLTRLRKTVRRHLWPAIEGSPEDLLVMRALATGLTFEDREEILCDIGSLDLPLWAKPFENAPPAPDDPHAKKEAA
jgi:hypothetical protein